MTEILNLFSNKEGMKTPMYVFQVGKTITSLMSSRSKFGIFECFNIQTVSVESYLMSKPERLLSVLKFRIMCRQIYAFFL